MTGPLQMKTVRTQGLLDAASSLEDAVGVVQTLETRIQNHVMDLRRGYQSPAAMQFETFMATWLKKLHDMGQRLDDLHEKLGMGAALNDATEQQALQDVTKLQSISGMINY